MNKFSMTLIVVSLALSTGVAALAADAEQPRSRAEVIAERDAALAAGTIAAFTGEDSGAHYLSQQPWVSQRSRAAVIAELYQARHSGELAAMTGEDSGSAFLSRGGASAAVRYAGPSPGQDDGTSVRLAMAGVPAVG